MALVVAEHPLGPHADAQTAVVATVLADLARARVHLALAVVRALVVLEAVALHRASKERLARLARDAAEVRARRLVAAHVTLALVVAAAARRNRRRCRRRRTRHLRSRL